QRGLPRPTTACAIGAYEPQPSSIAATAGTPQQAAVGTAFAALGATVTDSLTDLLPGWSVTFTAPAQTGPSGTFASSATVTTNSSGVAVAPTFTANTHPGFYSVTANLVATPLGNAATFRLTNNGACVVTSTQDPIEAGKMTLRGELAEWGRLHGQRDHLR